jgi:WD40 repeat protein
MRTSLPSIETTHRNGQEQTTLLQVEISAFSHCGSILAITSNKGKTLFLYNMKKLRVASKLSLSSMPLGRSNVLAFSPDNTWLILCLKSNEVLIIEVQNDRLAPRRLTVTPPTPRSALEYYNAAILAFDPGGSFVAHAAHSNGDRNVQIMQVSELLEDPARPGATQKACGGNGGI